MAKNYFLFVRRTKVTEHHHRLPLVLMNRFYSTNTRTHNSHLLGNDITVKGVNLASVVVDPVEDCLVPEQRVLPVDDPVVLVREVEEAGRHTEELQSVEHGNAFADGESVVEVVVDDELGSGEVLCVRQRVRLGVDLALVPDGAVVLVQHEEELLGAKVRVGGGYTVVADKSLELVAEVVALDPCVVCEYVIVV